MLKTRNGFLSETGLMQSRKWLSSSCIMFSRSMSVLGTRGNRFYSPWLGTIFIYHIFPFPSLEKTG